MKIYEQLGPVAIGTRLRQLTEMVTDDAAHIYKLYGIDMNPKWFPVFYSLSDGSNRSVTSIAREIGHSHPSVSKIVREMSQAKLVVEKKDKTDGRRNVLSLSPKGLRFAEMIEAQYRDMGTAITGMLAQTKHDLWKAIEEWEYLLAQQSLVDRVKAQQRLRERENIEIVQYRPEYAHAFRELNLEWITTYFKVEEADRVALDDPEGYIIRNGGFIFVALYKKQPVGVCALINTPGRDYQYELAKMAVSPRMQGMNIGWLLATAAIAKAKKMGATKLYLESNTRLKPALGLYSKLGFRKVAGHPTPYERANIQMELDLGQPGPDNDD